MATVKRTYSSSSDPLPRIRDPRLLLALRAVWAVFMITGLLVTIVSIPAYIQTCNCTPDVVAVWEGLGIAQKVRIIFTSLTLINMIILLALSTLIIARRPDDRMALFVALTSIVQGIFLVAGPAGSPEKWYLAVRIITNYLTPISWVGLLFLFPNGHFYPTWTRWLLLTLAILLLGVFTVPGTSLPGRIIAGAALILAVVSILAGLCALLRRYRETRTATQRQQIKWTLYALVFMAVILLITLPLQLVITDPTDRAIYAVFRHRRRCWYRCPSHLRCYATGCGISIWWSTGSSCLALPQQAWACCSW